MVSSLALLCVASLCFALQTLQIMAFSKKPSMFKSMVPAVVGHVERAVSVSLVWRSFQLPRHRMPYRARSPTAHGRTHTTMPHIGNLAYVNRSIFGYFLKTLGSPTEYGRHGTGRAAWRGASAGVLTSAADCVTRVRPCLLTSARLWNQ